MFLCDPYFEAYKIEQYFKEQFNNQTMTKHKVHFKYGDVDSFFFFKCYSKLPLEAKIKIAREQWIREGLNHGSKLEDIEFAEIMAIGEVEEPDYNVKVLQDVILKRDQEVELLKTTLKTRDIQMSECHSLIDHKNNEIIKLESELSATKDTLEYWKASAESRKDDYQKGVKKGYAEALEDRTNHLISEYTRGYYDGGHTNRSFNPIYNPVLKQFQSGGISTGATLGQCTSDQVKPDSLDHIISVLCTMFVPRKERKEAIPYITSQIREWHNHSRE